MPIQVQTYKRRVATPSAGSTPVAQTQGVGDIGQAFQRGAGALEEAFAIYNKKEHETAETDALRASAQTRMNVEQSYVKAQETAKPGAEDFTPGFMSTYTKIVDDQAGALTSELARKKYREKMLGLEVGLQNRALQWEAGQRQAHRVQNFTDATDLSASTLYSTDAMERDNSYTRTKQELLQSLDSVELPPDQREALRTRIREKLSYAGAQGDLRDRPEHVQDWLIRGTGTGYYSKLRSTESGGRNVQSDSSSAFGPYQFTKSTWQSVIDRHPELELTAEDRYKPMKQEPAIRAFTEDNAKILKRNGFAATNVNLYMMHFLGEQGGVEFLNAVKNNKDDEASLHVSDAAKNANPGVFREGRKVKDVYLIYGQKFGPVKDAEKEDNAPAYYADLTFAHRDALYGQAETELNKRRSQAQGAFKQRVDNAIAEFNANGQATDVPSETEFVAAYGTNRGTLEYGSFMANTIGAKATSQLRTMPLGQANEYVEGLKPKAGDPFFQEKLAGYMHAKQVQGAVRSAIYTDSAKYIQGIRPDIAQTFQEANAAGTADERKTAAERYVTALDAEADRMGIPIDARRLAPETYPSAIEGLLKNALTKENQGAAVADSMKQLHDTWGDAAWARIYKDIHGKLGPVANVLASGVDPHAAVVLADIANQTQEDVLKGVPDADKNSLRSEVDDVFHPLMKSMDAFNGEVKAFNDFYGQGSKLAAYYYRQGMATDDAAALAFEQLVGFKYDFVNMDDKNVRLPKGKAGLNQTSTFQISRLRSETVLETGLDQLKRDFSPEMFAGIQGAPVSLSDEKLSEIMLSNLRRNGVWRTAADESGLVLHFKGAEVKGPGGAPLIWDWVAVRDAAAAASPDAIQGYAKYRGDSVFRPSTIPLPERATRQ